MASMKGARRRPASWRTTTTTTTRPGRRWERVDTRGNERASDFTHYNTKPEIPTYDDATYEQHLTHPHWTKGETDYLLETYLESNGKWPVIIDRYSYPEGSNRSMEELKSRFYQISATILQLRTPITSMTAPEYSLYETLSNFNPKQEASRKQLAEGHLSRPQNEVDEEGVLLSELQRIMLNQATLDNEREELRRRLDYPRANTNGYQYTSSQALTGLWQQLLAADRMKKNQRLRATATPGNSLPVDLSDEDMLRLGVVQSQDKLPSGITFASDKLSKPRIAKSTIQTDKIAAILQHAGVPDLIPLPTPAVVEQFDAVMSKVHALLDLRKVGEREAQEIRVREAEAQS
ncbi:swr complex subunit [Saxophila tyrrhenica]|uniref:SWR1-complex protein 4 n=1 Tax=Saxophila tyrrhenica TaxID=1690608 RepID=A0AAV9NYR6_9PEZI|nr:swr complex subunit [Saxophila tyrrhenica]